MSLKLDRLEAKKEQELQESSAEYSVLCKELQERLQVADRMLHVEKESVRTMRVEMGFMSDKHAREKVLREMATAMEVENGKVDALEAVVEIDVELKEAKEEIVVKDEEIVFKDEAIRLWVLRGSQYESSMMALEREKESLEMEIRTLTLTLTLTLIGRSHSRWRSEP